MANCGKAEREVDSRVTCSMCLEPYKGHYPKLLPCFHTFCLPCLTQLAITTGSCKQEKPSDAQQLPTASDEERSIICPTCRTVIPLPTGGVTEFQSNFYVTDAEEDEHQQPLVCNLCEDGEQQVNFSCSKCQHRFCAQCQRIHDKFCDPTKVTAEMGQGDVCNFADLKEKGKRQVKVMEEVISQLFDRQKKMDQRQQQIDSDINSHFAECLSRLINARDDCLKRLQTLKQTEGDRLHAQLTEAETIHTKLVNLFAEDQSLKKKPPLSVTELRAGLQADDDHQRIRKGAFDADKEDIVYTPGTVSPDFYVDLMGRVDTARHASGDDGDTSDTAMRSKIAAKDTSCVSRQPPLQKRSPQPHTASSTFDPDSFLDKLKFMEMEISSLKHESTTLGQDVSALRAQNTKICQDLTDLQTGRAQQQQTTTSLQADLAQVTMGNRNLSSDVKSLEESVSRLDQVVGSMPNAQLASDLRALQSDVVSLQQSETGQSSKLAHLEAQMIKIGTMVAFHTRLGKSVTLGTGKTLICKEVIFSVGGGYDNQSGIFTAPVSGLYLFMATASPWESDSNSHLFIMHEGQRVAYTSAMGRSLSTCHGVIKVAAGEKVLLQTCHTDNTFDSRWLTFFSGMLVQEEL